MSETSDSFTLPFKAPDWYTRLIAIDSGEMWKDGINFYRTANDGTWLCDFVDPKYFLDATNPS